MKTATKTKRTHASKAMKEFARRCHAAGLSYKKISLMISFSASTVATWCDPTQLAKNRANSARQRQSNPELCREQVRQWRVDNADDMPERRRRHYLANRQTCLDKQADYRENNREKVRAGLRAYFKTEKGIRASRLATSLRRYRKQNTPELVFLDGEWCEVDRDETWRVFSAVLLPKDERVAIQDLYLEAQRLTEETGVEYHIDHIQPLSKGGEHRLVNLQILDASENNSKYNNFRPEDQELLANRLFNL